MKKRDFEDWFNTRTDSCASFQYFTDFSKVFTNVDKIKLELNMLNVLIGSNNIEQDFIDLVNGHPEVLKAVPILLAKRGSEILVHDRTGRFNFNFETLNCSVGQYAMFMKNTGLFEMMSKHEISNLVDYVVGVEVGLDSNARKNRTGDAMEDVLEGHFIDAGLVKGKTYFKEMDNAAIKKVFGIDLKSVGNKGKVGKRWDFVFKGALGDIFVCECNFYNGGGSKLNETARSYKDLTAEIKDIPHVHFVWFTDGDGWNSAKNNLKDTFDVLDTLYDINDLDNGIITTLVNNVDYVKSLIEND